MKNKQLTYLFLLSLSISAVIAAERPRGDGHRGPQFTAEQKACLEGKLGPKESGNRPTREAMEAAFSACGIEKPKGPPPMDRGDRQPQSDNQQSDGE